jgi:hypothetical protein
LFALCVDRLNFLWFSKSLKTWKSICFVRLERELKWSKNIPL